MAYLGSDIFDGAVTENKTETTEKKLKVGIIGTGWIAGEHLREYLKMPDVEVVAGADIVPGKAEKFFKDFGVENARSYESGHALLEAEELDVVSICTYNCQHACCAIDASCASSNKIKSAKKTLVK